MFERTDKEKLIRRLYSPNWVPYEIEDRDPNQNEFESSESKSQSKVDLKSIQTGRCVWLSATEEAEFASRIVRCEMTVEDVDELLCDLYHGMNALVLKHAENSEERRSMAREVHGKIKEYVQITTSITPVPDMSNVGMLKFCSIRHAKSG